MIFFHGYNGYNGSLISIHFFLRCRILPFSMSHPRRLFLQSPQDLSDRWCSQGCARVKAQSLAPLSAPKFRSIGGQTSSNPHQRKSTRPILLQTSSRPRPSIFPTAAPIQSRASCRRGYPSGSPSPASPPGPLSDLSPFPRRPSPPAPSTMAGQRLLRAPSTVASTSPTPVSRL